MEATSEFEAGYRAIRISVALAEEPDLRFLRMSGPDAPDALDIICPCDTFLQDGAMKHTLLLDDQGIPFADVYACREGDAQYLIGYGPPSDEMAEWIRQRVSGAHDFTIDALDTTHHAFAIDGPYAWEFCADILGPDVLCLPYLSMLWLDDVLVCRAGRTGEYGYHLLVPSYAADAWRATLEGAREDFNAVWVGDTARAQCVMENFFFDIHREGRYGLTPFELQLQWRLSREKSAYPGAAALQNIRQDGWHRRMTAFVAPEPVHPNEEITCDGRCIGTVLAAGFSPSRSEVVGKALLARPYWHAGLDAFRIGDRPIQTISAPAIQNLSLRVNPYRHSYHTREEDGVG